MDDIRRRTWAPFVGAALAALTAGSLVVFSLVAQRTSLDGFPELRIATPAEATQGRPASITVQPVDGTGDGSRGPVSNDMAETTDAVATPLALIPLVPATIPSAPLDLAALADPATSRPNTTDTGRADGTTFDGRFRAEGVLLAGSRDGGGAPHDEQASKDSRRGDKGRHKSHGAKAKKDKAKKSKKSKKSKKPDVARSRRSSGGRGHTSSSAGSRSNGPQSGSKPSAAHKAQPSPQGPPAHSNAGGNGKSKGKGHKRH